MDDLPPVRRFDLDAQGLERVLGELEARILEAVWARRSATVKDVTDALGPDAHAKTTMTVMNRMVNKGLLRRERHGRAFTYTPALERDAFRAGVAERVVDGLLADFARPTLAHFVDTVDAQKLAELEELFQRRRNG